MEQTPDSWQQRADRLAREGESAGAPPTAWFEPLYAAAARGEVGLPWDKEAASPWLVEWAEREGVEGGGRRAVVVGAGLGVEAGYVASLGFTTTAFDVSPTAVRLAAERASAVEFVVADLFDLPQVWVGAFDLVVEQFTVQALPVSVRSRAVGAVASLVAPGGRVVVVQVTREEGEQVQGPPWPLTEAEVRSFTDHGLELVTLERVPRRSGGWDLWRAELMRPQPTSS